MSDRPVVFDDDNPEWTDEDFARSRPSTEMPPEMLAQFPVTTERLRKRGRPPAENPKVSVHLRLSPDVIAHFRASGPRWQTRIDETLRQAIKAGSAVEPTPGSLARAGRAAEVRTAARKRRS